MAVDSRCWLRTDDCFGAADVQWQETRARVRLLVKILFLDVVLAGNEFENLRTLNAQHTRTPYKTRRKHHTHTHTHVHTHTYTYTPTHTRAYNARRPAPSRLSSPTMR